MCFLSGWKCGKVTQGRSVEDRDLHRRRKCVRCQISSYIRCDIMCEEERKHGFVELSVPLMWMFPGDWAQMCFENNIFSMSFGLLSTASFGRKNWKTLCRFFKTLVTVCLCRHENRAFGASQLSWCRCECCFAFIVMLNLYFCRMPWLLFCLSLVPASRWGGV